MTLSALSSADECTAVHVWAHSSQPGCAKSMMSAVSVLQAARRLAQEWEPVELQAVGVPCP